MFPCCIVCRSLVHCSHRLSWGDEGKNSTVPIATIYARGKSVYSQSQMRRELAQSYCVQQVYWEQQALAKRCHGCVCHFGFSIVRPRMPMWEGDSSQLTHHDWLSLHMCILQQKSVSAHLCYYIYWIVAYKDEIYMWRNNHDRRTRHDWIRRRQVGEIRCVYSYIYGPSVCISWFQSM